MMAPNNDSRKLWVSTCERWMAGWIDSPSRQKMILSDWALTFRFLNETHLTLTPVVTQNCNPARQEKASAKCQISCNTLCFISLLHPFSIFELYSVTFERKLNYLTNTWRTCLTLLSFKMDDSFGKDSNIIVGACGQSKAFYLMVSLSALSHRINGNRL